MKPPAGIPSPITHNHFAAFGAIIHMFARHETLMYGIVSRIINQPSGAAAILMAELSYRARKDALLALVEQYRPQHLEKMQSYLGELHRWNQLRNYIAHSAWTEGTRPSSVKPLSMSVRGGSASPLGHDPDEEDYTLAQLESAARNLMDLHKRFRTYLFSVDLLPSADSDESSESTSADSGSPSAK